TLVMACAAAAHERAHRSKSSPRVNFRKLLCWNNNVDARRKVKSWTRYCTSSARLTHTMSTPTRSKAVWGPKRALGIFALVFALFGVSQPASAAGGYFPKLDADLEARAIAGSMLRKSRVIVTLVPGGVLPLSVQKYDLKGRIAVINGHILGLPDSELAALATNANVAHVHADGSVRANNSRNAVTSGAFFVRWNLGYSGAGIEVAVIDSGIATTHPDLGRNVTVFKDFVAGRTTRYDDYGHG